MSARTYFGMQLDSAALEGLYGRFNRREYVHPDPLEFLYEYTEDADREIVGLIASSLAYGRVQQILKSAALVLSFMGPSPRRFIEEGTPGSFHHTFKSFKHRFTTGDHLAELCEGMRQMLHRHGSLEKCFLSHTSLHDDTILPALAGFIAELSGGRQGRGDMFLPDPQKGSACKRLNLFLRWMVRKDAVDPGVWKGVRPAMLIVPLDVHMHRIAVELEITARKQADMCTALEVTEGFRKAAPLDPVKYDFVLTRFGISPLAKFRENCAKILADRD